LTTFYSVRGLSVKESLEVAPQSVLVRQNINLNDNKLIHCT